MESSRHWTRGLSSVGMSLDRRVHGGHCGQRSPWTAGRPAVRGEREPPWAGTAGGIVGKVVLAPSVSRRGF